ncbi:two-component system phosphate regulon sensor histidine kinase PhoR [Rhizobium mongolense]|uniref:histidine kinase n=3 Tax=Rhizobium mongolense TaxID=57676 RepID=A0ABR6IRN0_9HYPH|nr:two-component system phosphate regulon sensor histidine kinase PhoR [Rhizobium mongolense]TVZ65369.1 two-component system phosphate regulon sensor histidine kinase PhoR [Rhizobium mongolense USDA 1844]
MPWTTGLMARIRQQRTVLLAAIVIGLVALAAGMNKWAVLGLLVLMIAIVLLNSMPGVQAKLAEPPEVEPEAPASLLPAVSATLAGLDIPVMLLSGDASVLFQNRAAEKAFGEVVIGAHISARLRSPGILDMVGETIATNAPNQIEHSERLPSERVYIVRSAPIDLGGAGNGERFFLLSFRDISEVRRIDRMRSDFVANASHELRTPLASLRGFIETIQGPAKNDPKAQERFLGIMFDQTTRMSRLVDDLLSLSRLELKSHIAPDEKVDLVPLLGHVRDALVPLATEVGVEINLHLPEGKAEVLGDRDELVQVFENLMENACKYGQEGKVVDVRVKNASGEAVEVSIADKGPGIPAEHVPRLTERFYRVNIEDSRSKKGTGLGLAIVKHILTRHRARLIVKSEIGKGTDFTVRF